MEAVLPLKTSTISRLPPRDVVVWKLQVPVHLHRADVGVLRWHILYYVAVVPSSLRGDGSRDAAQLYELMFYLGRTYFARIP